MKCTTLAPNLVATASAARPCAASGHGVRGFVPVMSDVSRIWAKRQETTAYPARRLERQPT